MMCLSAYFRHIVWGSELPVGMSVLIILQAQFACHSTMHLGSWKSIFQRTTHFEMHTPLSSAPRGNRRISTPASSTVCRHSRLCHSCKNTRKQKKVQCNEDTMLCFKSVQGIHKNYTLERKHTTRNCIHAGWAISWIWSKWLFISNVHTGVRYMRVRKSGLVGNDPRLYQSLIWIEVL